MKEFSINLEKVYRKSEPVEGSRNLEFKLPGNWKELMRDINLSTENKKFLAKQ